MKEYAIRMILNDFDNSISYVTIDDKGEWMKRFSDYADAKQFCIDNAELYCKQASITIIGCYE